jgi:hypothetical protein
MEKNLRKETFERFIETCKNNNKYNLSEAQIRHYCYFLADLFVDIQDGSHKAMVEMYHENTLTLEKSRNQFHEMVIFIEKNTNVILENLKSMGMIKKDFDKHGKAIIKGKTTVVTDMVNYMNKLNDLVIQFYQDVYLIQKMDDMKDENGRVQGSLF